MQMPSIKATHDKIPSSPIILVPFWRTRYATASSPHTHFGTRLKTNPPENRVTRSLPQIYIRNYISCRRQSFNPSTTAARGPKKSGIGELSPCEHRSRTNRRNKRLEICCCFFRSVKSVRHKYPRAPHTLKAIGFVLNVGEPCLSVRVLVQFTSWAK